MIKRKKMAVQQWQLCPIRRALFNERTFAWQNISDSWAIGRCGL